MNGMSQSGRGKSYRPNFRVSHQAIAKPYGDSMSSKSSIRMVSGDFVHVGRISVVDGIALFHR